MNPKRISALILSVIVLFAGISPNTSCGGEKFTPPPPMPILPAAYFKCTPLDPLTLIDAYYINYNSVALIEARYNGEIFVFKGIELTQKKIDNLKQGFVWVEMCQCAVINSGYVINLKVGDDIDVVGVNKGISKEFRGLVFSDCYIVPSGRLELPAPGQGGAFIGGY